MYVTVTNGYTNGYTILQAGSERRSTVNWFAPYVTPRTAVQQHADEVVHDIVHHTHTSQHTLFVPLSTVHCEAILLLTAC
jgi:hypothetical protein